MVPTLPPSDGTKDFYAEVYKLELDDTIVGRFGGADNPLGTFTTRHLMDCRHDVKIIAGYLLGWAKVMKTGFKRRPEAYGLTGREVSRCLFTSSN